MFSKLKYSLSAAFINKELRPGFTDAAHSADFHATTGNLEGLTDHLTTGSAFSPAIFKNNYRSRENFLSAQIAAVDLDEGVNTGEALNRSFVKQYAFLVYPTASSTPAKPKTRVLFLLSEPVEGAGRYEVITRAIIRELAELRPDVKCTDAPRFYYGSTHPQHPDAETYTNFAAVLPLELVAALTMDEAIADDRRRQVQRQEQPRATLTGEAATQAQRREKQYIEAAYNALLDDIHRAATGSRDDTVFNVTRRLYGLADASAFLNRARIDNDIRSAAAGLIAGDFTSQQLEKCIRQGGKPAYRPAVRLPDFTTKSPQRRRSIDPMGEKSAPKVNPVNLPAFTAAERVNLQYISQLDPATGSDRAALIIKSRLGTGKTELVSRIIEAREQALGRPITVLAIFHRVSLGKQAAARLGCLWHDELEGQDSRLLQAAPRLATTMDSLHKFAGRHFDLVILDEASQSLQHLLLGGTLTAGEPRRNYLALKSVIGQGGQVIALDAHATDLEAAWLRQTKGDILAIENTYRPERGRMMIHARPETVYNVLRQRVTGGLVALATSSKRESVVGARFLAATAPDLRGFTVNSDNSEGYQAQEFIQDINPAVSELDYLTYSPSLGTGVDIQTPAAVLGGIFLNQPITPADMMQMQARFRHAGERHVYVQPNSGHQTTDPDELYSAGLTNARVTAAVGRFSSQVDETLKEMHRYATQYQAQRNRAMNDPLAYFAALAADDGYTVVFVEEENRAIRAELKAIREAYAQELKAATLAAAPVDDYELDMHRRDGSLTEAHRRGHERYKMEQAAGQTLTPELYDQLRTADRRARLYRLADLLDNTADIAAADQAEDSGMWQLGRRHNRLPARRFFETLIRARFGCEWRDLPAVVQDMPADELTRRMSGIVEDYAELLTRLYGWQPGRDAATETGIFRYLLARYGLPLQSRRVAVNSPNGRKWQQVYTISPADWNAALDLAASSLKSRQQRRQERPAPVCEKLYIPIVEESAQSTATERRPPAPGWIPHPHPVKTLVYAPVGTGSSRYNPFASPTP